MHSRTEWPARISACRKARARKQSRREKSRVSMARESYRLWFCKCNDFNLHGVFSRDKRLQIQQCTAADRGHRRQAHTAAGHRIKHPLRDLQEPNSWVLIDAAPEHTATILGQSSVDRHSASTPRMPWVTDFSRFNIMGVALSTRTTRTARISDWGRERRIEEITAWPQVASILMRDWEGYTTGTIGLPNPNQRRRENVRVPASLISTGIPRGRSSGRDSWRSVMKG